MSDNNVNNALEIFGIDPWGDVVNHLKKDLGVIFKKDENVAGLLDYYKVRQMVFEWLEEQGDNRRFGGKPTKKGNAYYYYKQAMKYGDLEAARRYLVKYYELGGGERAVIQNIGHAHPLSSIPGMKRKTFRESLTPEQIDIFKKALKWYDNNQL